MRQVLFCRGATWSARLVFENTLTESENPTYTWRARHVRAPTNALQAPLLSGKASYEPLATNNLAPGVGDVGEFLERQCFPAAFAIDACFFQDLGDLFLAHARVFQGVGKGLAALLEGRFDDLEEALFVD